MTDLPAQEAAEGLAQLRSGLRVRIAVIDNAAQRSYDASSLGAVNGSLFRMRVTLTNTCDFPLPGRGWQLLIPSVRRLLAIDHAGLRLRHVTGDQHVIEPVAFEGLAPGETMVFDILGETVLIQLPEVLPRWCLRMGGQAGVLEATDNDDVRTFTDPMDLSQAVIDEMDITVVADAEWRYARNAELPDAAPVPLIPSPLRMTKGVGRIDLSPGIRFDVDPIVPDPTVDFWQSRARVLGLRPGPVSVTVRVRPDLPTDAARPEGYHLRISQSAVVIDAFDVAGANWGVMSLFGLLAPASEPASVGACEVVDAPRYGYRSLMVDIARNMRGLPFLITLLDQMAAYKLNHLHLHLTDDEGWRLQIPGLPELVEVGSRRGHGDSEADHLAAQLGTGLDGGSSGCGYLSRGEYIELLQAAKARGITVLPEINSPGHSRAAVMSMESRFDRTGDGTYRLIDPDDSTQLLTVQNYDRRAMLNPAVPGTWTFLRKVIAEVASMHDEAGQPLTAWHCGSDEVHNILLGSGFTDLGDGNPRLGQVDRSGQHHPWEGSPAAQALVADLGVESTRELGGWFVRQLAELVADAGISRLHVWQDGVAGVADASDLPLPVVVETWLTVDQGATGMLADLQSRGFMTVAATPEFTYFDAPYEPHPREQGTTWATRWVDERIALGFAPDNLGQVAQWRVDRRGRDYRVEVLADNGPMTGVQAHLWSEASRTDEQAWAMLFPRCLAVAERAWHRAQWEEDPVPGRVYGAQDSESVAAMTSDASAFLRALGTRELAKLDQAGIPYRVPLPGAVVRDGLLFANVSFPGLPIEYSADGAQTWRKWQAPVPISGLVYLRTRASGSERTSEIERVGGR